MPGEEADEAEEKRQANSQGLRLKAAKAESRRAHVHLEKCVGRVLGIRRAHVDLKKCVGRLLGIRLEAQG